MSTRPKRTSSMTTMGTWKARPKARYSDRMASTYEAMSGVAATLSGVKPWMKANILSSTRSEEHTSELQSQSNLVCRLLLEKKNTSASPHSYPPAKPVAEELVLALMNE